MKDVNIMKDMFAKRMSRMGESATLKAMEIANRLKAQGVDIISFNVGEPDFPTPMHIIKAGEKAMEAGFTHYTPSAGIQELRDAIAEKCKRDNKIPCEASNVMVATSKFCLFATILSLVDDGDEVIIPEPSWGSYVDMVGLAGGKVKHTGLKGDDGFRLTPEAVAELVTPKTKLMFLNSPCNPTGGIIKREDMKGLVELALDHKFFILSDEVYEHIIYEGEHVSPASFPGAFDQTITVNGFSKAYAMTGWRMGYMVAPKPLFGGIIKMQQQAVTCAPAFGQKACVTALKDPQSKKALDAMLKEFRERREVVIKGLNAMEGIKCPKSPATFYAFPSYDKKIYKKSSDDMADYMLEEAHVSVTSGRAFGPSGEGCFRLSYSNSLKNIKEGLKRIEDALKKLKK
jgi:aspartate aminotransferase